MRRIRTGIAVLSLAGLITLLACGGSSTAPATVFPSDASFGEVDVGGSAARRVTITNTSTSPLTVTDVSSDSGLVTSGDALPLMIPPGETASLSVELAPATEGDVSATVELLAAGETDPVAVFRATGRGVRPNKLTASGALVSFGDVMIGTSLAQDVTLTNAGTTSVSIASMAVSAAGVTATGLPLPATFAPGESATVTLTYAPTAAGPTSGSVTIKSEQGRPASAVEISGNGVAAAPAPAPAPVPVPATLAAAPTRLDFRQVTVGSFSAQGITLTNNGSEPITVSDVVTTGSGFTTSGLTAGTTIAAGGSQTLTVRFSPEAQATASGQVTVRTAGQTEPLAVVDLAGSGVAAASITSVTVRDTTVETSKTVQVQADVVAVGTIDKSVTWSVDPASLGTIDRVTGVYSAPAVPGTYRVWATSNADATKRGVGTVTVTATVTAPPVTSGSVYVVRPQYFSPTANPLKGMTGPNAPPYSTVSLLIIPWNQLENAATDGVEKIQAVSDALFGSYPARNTKIVPRVTLDDNAGQHWPSDMTPWDYSSTQFQTRLTRLISRLGQVWDNDPRIAWVETGIFGKWGEQTQPTPSPAIQAMTVDAFNAAFRNKKVLRRVPYMFTTSTWGIYWDSWGCVENGQLAAMGETFWNREVMQGEIAYDFCTATGATTPTQDVTIPEYINKNEDLIRQFHTTNLTWIAQAPYNDSTKAGMDRLHRAMGYEFTVDQVDYPQTLQPGQPFTIALKVRNTGSAPFYYPWPVEVSLHNPADRSVVWKQTLPGVDIRSWTPGTGWSATARAYSSPPPTTNNQSTVTLSSAVPPGRYVLAISILDPGGNLPTVRFAMRNYWMGGRHPIGYVGVGNAISSEVIDPAQFDDPGPIDTTLRYVR